MSASIDNAAPVALSAPGGGGLARAARANGRRVSRAVNGLGLAGAVAFVPVFLRLFEDWRVSPAAAHHISVFGQRLSYPVANVEAVIVLALAGLGAIVTVRALTAAARELRGARRLAAGLAGLRPTAHGDVLVLDDPRPEAFCAGLLVPRVYVTTGAIARLDPAGLDAVLAHERQHARMRDPLRLAAHRVIARALFFLPGVAELARGQRLFAELGADDSALEAAAGDASALARAMLAFGDHGEGAWAGIDPDRVDHLLGEPPNWRFPALMCGVAMLVLGLIVAVAVLAGRVAAGSATLAPPLLSAQPCIVLLAGLPGAVALAAARRSRRWSAGTPRR